MFCDSINTSVEGKNNFKTEADVNKVLNKVNLGGCSNVLSLDSTINSDRYDTF